jgi:hypothetical protein
MVDRRNAGSTPEFAALRYARRESQARAKKLVWFSDDIV